MNIIGISGLQNAVSFKKKEFPNLSARHYRIAQGFDSAAALVTSEGIQAVAAEERFTREKGTGTFPYNAIQFCLTSAGLSPENIDHVAHGFAYEPVKSFFENGAITRRQFDEVYSRDAQLRTLEEHFQNRFPKEKFVSIPHHLAHAASSFYLSGFSDSLILIADGMGELYSTTIAAGEKNKIRIIKQIPAFHSLGLLYGVVTLYLGFWMGLDEYKVMGLASYGDSRHYYNKFRELIHLNQDGTYSIPILFQNTTPEEKETYDGTIRILERMFGPSREPDEEITRNHMDIAAALQAGIEACLLHTLRIFQKQTGHRNLCMAGGVALNCTANGVILRSNLFENVFVQPAAGDDGSALGAALFLRHHYEDAVPACRMSLPFWGPRYSMETITPFIKEHPHLKCQQFERFDDLAREIAKRIAAGAIVGWFQGAMEFGPRALGNRSILADPRDPEMRQRINQKVKKREEFRPFAPAVKEEDAAKYFEIPNGKETTFAHMLFVTQVQAKYRNQLPAITHVDGSARVQTVSRADHPRFWMLLSEFEKISGFPVLLNTSFNIRGQPIVCTPQEALETYELADLDALVMENFLIEEATVWKYNPHDTERHRTDPLEFGGSYAETQSKAQEFVGPRNHLEKTLLGIWSEVLGVDRIGIHDNFFDLGGHSLLVAQVLYRVRDTLSVQLSPRSLFDAPTIAMLAAIVERRL